MATIRYKVLSDTSTRANPDPESPDYETWQHWAAGEIATSWPAHAPVDEWVASGHWEPIAKRDGSVTPAAEGES